MRANWKENSLWHTSKYTDTALSFYSVEPFWIVFSISNVLFWRHCVLKQNNGEVLYEASYEGFNRLEKSGLSFTLENIGTLCQYPGGQLTGFSYGLAGICLQCKCPPGASPPFITLWAWKMASNQQPFTQFIV